MVNGIHNNYDPWERLPLPDPLVNFRTPKCTKLSDLVMDFSSSSEEMSSGAYEDASSCFHEDKLEIMEAQSKVQDSTFESLDYHDPKESTEDTSEFARKISKSSSTSISGSDISGYLNGNWSIGRGRGRGRPIPMNPLDGRHVDECWFF